MRKLLAFTALFFLVVAIVLHALGAQQLAEDSAVTTYIALILAAILWDFRARRS